MIAPAEVDPCKSTSLADIESQCKRLSDARALLEENVAVFNAEIASVRDRYLKEIKRRASAVAGREAELYNLVESAPELFSKPRTVIFHGVKCGFVTGAGAVEWDDDAEVVKLIKKHLKEQAEVLIISKEVPSAAALKQLTAVDLARVGCRLEKTGDQVVLKFIDGEIEKLVNKLIAKMVDTMVNPDDARN